MTTQAKRNRDFANIIGGLLNSQWGAGLKVLDVNDPAMMAAIRSVQHLYGLPETGMADPATHKAIRSGPPAPQHLQASGSLGGGTGATLAGGTIHMLPPPLDHPISKPTPPPAGFSDPTMFTHMGAPSAAPSEIVQNSAWKGFSPEMQQRIKDSNVQGAIDRHNRFVRLQRSTTAHADALGTNEGLGAVGSDSAALSGAGVTLGGNLPSGTNVSVNGQPIPISQSDFSARFEGAPPTISQADFSGRFGSDDVPPPVAAAAPGGPSGGPGVHEGLISSPVPGRTDQLPISVGADSYVIPADVVSGMGQGNTDAGANVLDQLMKELGVVTPAYAAGGATPHPIDIIAAGGEYVVPPGHVTRIGNGNAGSGHKILDNMVNSVRRTVARRMLKLPGPRRD